MHIQTRKIIAWAACCFSIQHALVKCCQTCKVTSCCVTNAHIFSYGHLVLIDHFRAQTGKKEYLVQWPFKTSDKSPYDP